MKIGSGVRPAAGLGLLLAGVWILGCGGPRVRPHPAPFTGTAETGKVPEPPPPPSPPETEEMTAQGAVKLHFPDPGYRGLPPLFTWYRFPHAAGYRIVVMDMEGKTLLEGPRVTANGASLDPGWERRLPGAGIYFWQVVALNGEGNPVAKSSLRDFVFTP